MFDASFELYQRLDSDTPSILAYLEFGDSIFHDAFTLPENEEEMVRVDRKGKALTNTYLYNRCVTGKNAGVLTESIPEHCREVWESDKRSREEKLRTWKRSLLDEQASCLTAQITQFNRTEKRLQTTWAEKSRSILREMCVIG